MEISPLTPHELYLKSYSCTNEAEIEALYDEWAQSYDAQMQNLSWEAPAQIAELLSEAFTIEARAGARILDLGAGTGLVGVALSKMGFRLIDAFDISSEMLKEAQAREVYATTICKNAEKLSECVSEVYDAVVCVGALNFGHIPPSALPELVKVTKPSGYICFSTREDYYQKGARAMQDLLETTGKWELIAKKYRQTSISDMAHLHWLYRRN